MNHSKLFQVIVVLLLISSKVQASTMQLGEFPVGIHNPIALRIETVDQNVFFVVDFYATGVISEFGDTLELVLVKNKRIVLYNIASEHSSPFLNTKDKLVAFVSAEDLRNIQKLKLKKVIITKGTEIIVLKANIPASFFEIN